MKICFNQVLRVYFFFSFIFSSHAVFSAKAFEPEMEGLEYLLFESIPTVVGSVTQIEADKTPVSITTISRSQIEIAPVRNLMDLLEMFVPGFIWEIHYDSNHMGMRGIMVDRDYKTLLVVNGRVLNQKAMNGISTEMENWDLNDIEKVEVIRGPGSVTYGAGAVAGVISITTKNSNTSTGTQAGYQYVSGYESNGAHFNTSFGTENFSSFLYGSVTSTRGETEPDIYLYAPARGSAEYVDHDTAADYFNDTDNDPQYKFYWDLNFLKEFKFWARYTNSGTNRLTDWVGSADLAVDPPGTDNTRDMTDDQITITQTRQYVFALENEHRFDDDLSLKTSVSYDSIDCFRSEKLRLPYNGLNYNFAEDKLLVKTLLNYNLSDKYKFGFGLEYEREHYGKGWGDNANEFLLFDGLYIINGPTSRTNLYGTSTAISVGNDGFSSYSYSALGEFYVKELLTNLDFMISGRMDKNKDSKNMYSPRMAFIYSMENIGFLKLVAQESVRMSTGVQLYAEGYFGSEADPEKLKGLELIYNSVKIGNLSFNASLFYNELEVVGWASTGELNADGTTKGSTALLGDLTVYGTELEVKYETEKSVSGWNHAYIKQQDYEQAGGAPGFNQISMADFSINWDGGLNLSPTGNDLRSYPRHMTKLYSQYKINDQWSVFEALRISWDYEGDEDFIEMYENAAASSTDSTVKNNVESSSAEARKDDLLGTNFFFDMSIRYKFNENASVSLFGLNLIPIENNKRYQYANLSIVAIDEPTVAGIKVNVGF